MIKLIKILVIIAIICTVIILAIALYTYFLNRGHDAIVKKASTEMRQELFGKYFSDINLKQETYHVGEQLILSWALNPEFKKEGEQDLNLTITTLDKQKDIFISETEPINFTNYDATKINVPDKIGNYEIWVYVLEKNTTTGETEKSLVKIISFEIN